MEKKEKINFAEGIDYTDLFYHASEITETELIFDTPEITVVNDNVSVRFKSNDITQKCGAFKNILDCCYVNSFASMVDIDTVGELFLWIDISLFCEHKNGEMLNMKLFDAWYTKQGWVFANVGE